MTLLGGLSPIAMDDAFPGVPLDVCRCAGFRPMSD